MKFSKKSGMCTLLFLGLSSALAHGEDELGPHQGLVRMPGAYHMEVVKSDNGVDIMLLDMGLRNPTVLNSSIKVSVKSDGKTYMIPCESETNYFTCHVKKKLLNHDGKLIVASIRQLDEGETVEFGLPLKIENQLV